ncbi:MAG: LysM peptidoglycan-binding domain-containing protein [Gammaproteobacteria bacterium]
MNTATISTRCLRLIVTCLLITGVSACAFPDKRKPEQSQIDNVIAAETIETPVAAQTEYTKPKHTAIRVKKSHPRKYIVKKGDTLWDISSQFLRDPWYWPEIWHKNRQVQNPHLIYPGDELTLIYVNGQPQISVNETPQQVSPQEVTPPVIRTTITSDHPALRRVKLSPSIRKQGIDADVFTIPGDSIRQFLTKPRVVTKEELEEAPYILASDDNHLIMGQDNIVYIRGELDKDRVRFTVFRPGEELIDPETDNVFGFEAIYAGEVHIKKYGDPAIGQLTSSTREIRVGDRLLPVDKSKIDNLYYPRPPDHELKGQIISLHDALFGIAKYQIAVINRGSRDSLEIGHLLETQSAGDDVKDNYSLRQRGNVRLPDVRSGLMMVFRVFDKVSYGLILESTLVINNHDVVTTPR